MGWLGKKARKSGWLVIEMDGAGMRYVHGRAMPNGKPEILMLGESGPAAADPARVAKAFHFARYACATLLRPGEYQVLQVEAPAVPDAEMTEAVRWRLKDLLDYPVEQATLDVLRFPPQAETAGRAANVYAVAARKEAVRTCMQRFEQASIPLTVIDIPEMAQRNIGALCEEPGRGLAVLHATEDACLLTVNFSGELLLARRIEIGTREFASERNRSEEFERIALEMQRTFDLLDRQYPSVVLSRLMIGPLAQDFGLAPYLEQNLGMRIESLDLAKHIEFSSGAPDAATQWRLFHILGASLRH